MYESYFELSEKPFSIQPDPDYLYLSGRHKLAFSMMLYSVESSAGFTVITGDIGSGKTTLLRRLLSFLPENTTVGLVSNTHQSVTDLLQWVMLAFDQPYEYSSKVAMFDAFQQFLIDEYAKGRQTLLIIDEAQNLPASAMEELRLLSNINADKDQLLRMILLGQPELQDLLSLPELKQFAQRVAVDFRLLPLQEDEVEGYINHRLKVAGAKEQIFTPAACAVIAKVTKGVPRSINVICDTAMVYAMAMENTKEINEKLIQEVVKDRREYGAVTSENDSPTGVKRLIAK